MVKTVKDVSFSKNNTVRLVSIQIKGAWIVHFILILDPEMFFLPYYDQNDITYTGFLS